MMAICTRCVQRVGIRSYEGRGEGNIRESCAKVISELGLELGAGLGPQGNGRDCVECVAQEVSITVQSENPLWEGSNVRSHSE